MSQSCALPDRGRPALLDKSECTRRATGDDEIIAASQDTAATFFTAFFVPNVETVVDHKRSTTRCCWSSSTCRILQSQIDDLLKLVRETGLKPN